MNKIILASETRVGGKRRLPFYYQAIGQHKDELTEAQPATRDNTMHTLQVSDTSTFPSNPMEETLQGLFYKS